MAGATPLSLSADENTGTAARTETITLKSSHGKRVSVNVSQAYFEPVTVKLTNECELAIRYVDPDRGAVTGLAAGDSVSYYMEGRVFKLVGTNTAGRIIRIGFKGKYTSNQTIYTNSVTQVSIAGINPNPQHGDQFIVVDV